MPPSEAEQHGYERANKYPKSTKFGRQNPITARWNSDEQLVVWRENWAQITNKYLDEANRSDAHIDHRSHAARGIDEQPTIHEGYVAQAMERRGLIADRCELNRQIKADNTLKAGLVLDVIECEGLKAPYPPDRTKHILRLFGDDEPEALKEQLPKVKEIQKMLFKVEAHQEMKNVSLD